jgi:hypothetical protein
LCPRPGTVYALLFAVNLSSSNNGFEFFRHPRAIKDFCASFNSHSGRRQLRARRLPLRPAGPRALEAARFTEFPDS